MIEKWILYRTVSKQNIFIRVIGSNRSNQCKTIPLKSQKKKLFLSASWNLFIFSHKYKINQKKTIQSGRVINALSNHIEIKNFWSLVEIWKMSKNKWITMYIYDITYSNNRVPDVWLYNIFLAQGYCIISHKKILNDQLYIYHITFYTLTTHL